MIFTPLPLEGVYRIDLDKREDERGFFARLYCEREFGSHALPTHWVQMNTTFTKNRGAVRGLHFQREPKTEAKVVRCLKGAIYDVVVDLRQGSPTFGSWLSFELNEDNRTMLYVPPGFAHGLQTLTENCELLYLHAEFYSPECEGGVRCDDPSLNIEWPLPIDHLSERDQRLPLLRDIKPILL